VKLVEPPVDLKCPPVVDSVFCPKELKPKDRNTTIGMMDFLINLISIIEFKIYKITTNVDLINQLK
jgi:hypothetical protein